MNIQRPYTLITKIDVGDWDVDTKFAEEFTKVFSLKQ